MPRVPDAWESRTVVENVNPALVNALRDLDEQWVARYADALKNRDPKGNITDQNLKKLIYALLEVGHGTYLKPQQGAEKFNRKELKDVLLPAPPNADVYWRGITQEYLLQPSNDKCDTEPSVLAARLLGGIYKDLSGKLVLHQMDGKNKRITTAVPRLLQWVGNTFGQMYGYAASAERARLAALNTVDPNAIAALGEMYMNESGLDFNKLRALVEQPIDLRPTVGVFTAELSSMATAPIDPRNDTPACMMVMIQHESPFTSAPSNKKASSYLGISLCNAFLNQIGQLADGYMPQSKQRTTQRLVFDNTYAVLNEYNKDTSSVAEKELVAWWRRKTTLYVDSDASAPALVQSIATVASLPKFDYWIKDSGGEKREMTSTEYAKALRDANGNVRALFASQRAPEPVLVPSPDPMPPASVEPLPSSPGALSPGALSPGLLAMLQPSSPFAPSPGGPSLSSAAAAAAAAAAATTAAVSSSSSSSSLAVSRKRTEPEDPTPEGNFAQRLASAAQTGEPVWLSVDETDVAHPNNRDAFLSSQTSALDWIETKTNWIDFLGDNVKKIVVQVARDCNPLLHSGYDDVPQIDRLHRYSGTNFLKLRTDVMLDQYREIVENAFNTNAERTYDVSDAENFNFRDLEFELADKPPPKDFAQAYAELNDTVAQLYKNNLEALFVSLPGAAIQSRGPTFRPVIRFVNILRLLHNRMIDAAVTEVKQGVCPLSSSQSQSQPEIYPLIDVPGEFPYTSELEVHSQARIGVSVSPPSSASSALANVMIELRRPLVIEFGARK